MRLNYLIMGVLVLAVAFILVDRFVLVGEPGKTTVASLMGSATPDATNDATTTQKKSEPELKASSPSAKVRRASLNLGQAQALPPSASRPLLPSPGTASNWFTRRMLEVEPNSTIDNLTN